MSATNRGNKEKIKHEQYETPSRYADCFLMHINSNHKRILEPCCGNGSITEALRRKYPTAFIHANDIQKMSNNWADLITQRDYLTMTEGEFDLIISNPPFSLAEEIIRHSLTTWEATLIMLLRLNFLGSLKRYKFWGEYPVSRIYPTSKRPSFTGKGTDATEYAWFVWEPDYISPDIVVIKGW